MADHHTIVVQHEIFGAAFEVRVTPTPLAVGHDREFHTIAEARAYAERLAAATGWRIADLLGGGDA
jgi:hypothetical protein